MQRISVTELFTFVSYLSSYLGWFRSGPLIRQACYMDRIYRFFTLFCWILVAKCCTHHLFKLSKTRGLAKMTAVRDFFRCETQTRYKIQVVCGAKRPLDPLISSSPSVCHSSAHLFVYWMIFCMICCVCLPKLDYFWDAKKIFENILKLVHNKWTLFQEHSVFKKGSKLHSEKGK